jgi:predicted transglutaminase-like cysteine proteinase
MWDLLKCKAHACRRAATGALAVGLTAVALGGGLGSDSTSQAHVVPASSSVLPPLWVAGWASPTTAWVEFCRRLPAECQINTAEPSTIALTLETWRTLVAVNEQVNTTIKAIPDREHWSVQDRWDYPDDGIGDCEDIQLLKRKLLAEAGLPRRALRMAVVFDETGDGHAVLMALTDRGEFILDNKRSAVLPWNQTGYTYLKREGSDGLAWASLVGRLSPITADVAADLREKALSSAPATSSSAPAHSGV